jgi:hypothetical protein
MGVHVTRSALMSSIKSKSPGAISLWNALPRLLLAFLCAASAHVAAPSAKRWQRVDGCTWKADRWNDGDSFHVIIGDAGREIVARLYFVDTV